MEIACGTGYWTQFIAPSAARIVAVDSAPETLRIAKERVLEGMVQFIVGDAYTLPVQIGVFSAAFAGFWFSHVPKARRLDFLLGLGKLLKPGSKVVLIDYRYVEDSSSPVTEQDSEGNTYQTCALNDGSAHRILKNFPSEAELQASIVGLGESGTFTRWSYYWAFEYVTKKP